MLQNNLQDNLLTNLRSLIDSSKSRLSQTVNQEMTLLYWNIGKTVQTEILKFGKPEYGQQIIERLGETLQFEYGRGFGVFLPTSPYPRQVKT